MKIPIVFASPRVRLALLVVGIIGLGSFGVGARARLKSHFAREPSVGDAPVLVAAPPQSAGTSLPSHLLTLQPTGFEPAEVRWPKERFFLIVDNRSGVDDITLRVDRAVGGRLKEVRLRMRKQRSAGVFDPPPGKYLLTEANHPGWVCRITISPR
jgi:hypothetical protein